MYLQITRRAKVKQKYLTESMLVPVNSNGNSSTKQDIPLTYHVHRESNGQVEGVETGLVFDDGVVSLHRKLFQDWPLSRRA